MKDEGTIDLRSEFEEDEPEFKIENIAEIVSRNAESDVASKAHDKVKVKFDKFVGLIAANPYDEIFEKNADEDVIISTNLLTDLASVKEPKQDKKMPLVFIFGAVLGVILTWLILKL